MPRNGSGVYSKPGGTTFVATTVIESVKMNQLIDDLVSDANAARPIVAGGTGATSAAAARTALGVPGLTSDNSLTGINTYTKIQKWSKGADVASATTLTLGDDGNYFDVTGTTTTTGIATKGAGTVVKLHFDGAVPLTHHSTDFILPGGANYTTAAGDEFEFTEYDTGDWRCTGYALASGLSIIQPVQDVFPGGIFGLTLVNNGSDAANDIDVATGAAASDASTPTTITLASAITKRIDASWAVGTNQGGLDTGSVANTTYYVWLIERSDTGVVDVLFSTSSTAPTMPTNYDRKRLLGFFVRASAANGIPVNFNKPEFQYSGSAPMFAPRVWCKFNGSGTLAVAASGNVTTVADNGTGDYTVNYATALADANAAVLITAISTGSTTLIGPAGSTYNSSSTGCRFQVRNASGTLTDVEHVSFAAIR